MARFNDKHQLFTRRAMVLGGLQAACLVTLAGRLYYLQFIRSKEYSMLSENNRIKLQLTIPERGRIEDRNGVALALNEQNYQLFADASNLKRKQLDALLAQLQKVVPLNERLKAQALDSYRRNRFTTLLLKENLSWEEVATMELRQAEFPNVSIETGMVRTYPFSDHAAHLIGYVGAVSPEEQDKDPELPILRHPLYRIGKSGVERMAEERLRGNPGMRELEVNVHGAVVREISKRDSLPGQHLKLTVDNRLQEFGTRILAGESASVVMLNVKNGNILCMMSTPGFDPNIFSKGIPADYWKSLQEDPKIPLLNKAIQGQYPPGSTFKMLVGLAGLATGKITPQTQVHCPGHFYLGNHRFNCWKPEGHGTVNLEKAIAESCDTYFYTVSQRCGIDAIGEQCRRYGLGELHLPNYPSEKLGLVPSAEWKMQRYKQRWTPGDTVNVGIGQGYILATPMQLAVMTARMVTGMKVKPRLLADNSDPTFEPLTTPEEHLDHIRKGMYAVVNEPGGTAYGKRILDPKYTMAGKTGTSQVRKIEKRGLDQNSLPWEYRHHALFVGFAPYDAPRYAVVVAVEHGGGGSAAAAPRARDLLWKAMLLDDGIEEDPKSG